jgi:hypothetical protein
LHVERHEEEDSEHRERDEEDRKIRAREGAVAEEAEVEHGEPLTRLEQDEGNEHRDCDGEGAEDPARGPAVRVRLDQSVREREEADPRGQKPRQVETLLDRLVLRFGDQQQARRDRDHSDRDVDEEDPAPADVLGQ